MITAVSPARIMNAALQTVGLGTMSGDWKSVYSTIPASDPVRRIGVKSMSPLNHGKDPDGSPSQHFGVQITVRSTTAEEGEVKSLRVIERLLRCKPTSPISVALDGTWYKITHVVLASGPVYIGTEEYKDSELHSINLLFVAEEFVP